MTTGKKVSSERDDTKSAFNRRNVLLSGASLLTLSIAGASGSSAQDTKAANAPSMPNGGNKPNILVLWGDDIGIANLSAYSNGLMGYETPNIDRIAKEGLKFQHYYGEQSCTAGRSAFLTGQHIMRSGLARSGFLALRWE